MTLQIENTGKPTVFIGTGLGFFIGIIKEGPMEYLAIICPDSYVKLCENYKTNYDTIIRNLEHLKIHAQ